jgi:hypothetical protein
MWYAYLPLPYDGERYYSIILIAIIIVMMIFDKYEHHFYCWLERKLRRFEEWAYERSKDE